MERKDAVETAKLVADMLNTFAENDQIEKFIGYMVTEHRTLQQSFTKLVLGWVAACGSDGYRHDARNLASHTTCKKIVEAWEKEHPDFPFPTTLPMI
jgi:hypothetical protein